MAPRLPWLGDRDGIERELTEAELGALKALWAADPSLPEDFGRWPEVSWFRLLMETAAWNRLADRLRTERGCSEERAGRDAAAALGLNYETLEARARLPNTVRTANGTRPRSSPQSRTGP